MQHLLYDRLCDLTANKHLPTIQEIHTFFPSNHRLTGVDGLVSMTFRTQEVASWLLVPQLLVATISFSSCDYL